MIQNKTIVLCFLGVLAAYLILRLGLLLQYLTLSQVAVTAAALLVAVLDGRKRGSSLLRLRAPREEKDLRLFLLGKNLALVSAAALLVLAGLSLLPGSRFYWNPEALVEGMPVPVTHRQWKVVNKFIGQYEECKTAEEWQKFLAQMRAEKATALWAATLACTTNRQLQNDLIPALEEQTSLQLKPTGELTPEAVREIVRRVQAWQQSHPEAAAPAASAALPHP